VHSESSQANPLPESFVSGSPLKGTLMAAVHRLIARAAILAAALLLITGCGGGAGNTGTGDGGTTTPESTAAEPTVDPGVEQEVQELVSDYNSAVEGVNGFWTRHWQDHFNGAYREPTLIEGGTSLRGVYDGNEGVAECGGDVLPPNNALYCRPDHSLAFDVNFLLSMNRKIGDSFVYMVVAHEWGHAVAAQINQDAQSVAGELTADCLAGAAIYGLVEDGELALEEGDVKEITNGLTDVADESPWGDPTDHGDPFQRIEAFNAGRTGGPGACFKSG
jgi:predicted metalloprotease